MRQDGFTLLEILIALMLLGLSLLAVAPLFVMSARANDVAAQIGTINAAAMQRMEQLRQVDFDTLTAGGSLTSDTTGFYDDSNPDYELRWKITDDATPPRLKTLEVWVRSRGLKVGKPKEVTIVSILAE